MFCRYCGKEVAEDSKFCTYCGKMIVDRDRYEEENEVLATRDEKEEEKQENEDLSYLDVFGSYEEKEVKEEEKEVVIEDLFLENMSRKNKILLFLSAIILIAIVAIIVLGIYFPNVI